MIQHEIEENQLIDNFLASATSTQDDLSSFLTANLVHPGLYSQYGRQVIRNLVGITYDYYAGLELNNKRHFIKILVKLVYLALSMKRWIFNLSRKDAMQAYASAPLFFTFVTNLTEPLEAIRRELAAIDPGLVMKRLLLVEGATEASFIEVIQLSTELLNFDFDVYAYGGKGHISNLVYLIREKNRQGISVHLSYDADRESTSFEQKLRRQCNVENFFRFARDFESAFPPALLTQAINAYILRNTKLQVQLDQPTVEALLAEKLPFIEGVRHFLKTDIVKPVLGGILAELTLHDNSLWEEATDEKRLSTEIAKFLRFLMLW